VGHGFDIGWLEQRQVRCRYVFGVDLRHERLPIVRVEERRLDHDEREVRRQRAVPVTCPLSDEEEATEVFL